MKILLIFLFFCTSAFATEPHFDLPKKDAKAFCLIQDKIVEECYYTLSIPQNKQFNLLQCGNVFLKRTEVDFSLYEEGGGVVFLILDQQGNYIGYNTSIGNGEIKAGIPIANNGGYYVGDGVGENDDGKYLTHIPTWLIKKHKKLIDNSKIAIKVEDCYVKEVKFKY